MDCPSASVLVGHCEFLVQQNRTRVGVMNTFLSVRRGREPFSPDAGECELEGNNIVAIYTRAVAVPNVVVDDALGKALDASGAKDGKIHLFIHDAQGNEYSVIVKTEMEW